MKDSLETERVVCMQSTVEKYGFEQGGEVRHRVLQCAALPGLIFLRSNYEFSSIIIYGDRPLNTAV